MQHYIEQSKRDMKIFLEFHLPSEGVKCLDTKRINTFIHAIHCLVLHVYYPELSFFDYFFKKYWELKEQLNKEQNTVLHAKIRKLVNVYFNHYKSKSVLYAEKLATAQKNINDYFKQAKA